MRYSLCALLFLLCLNALAQSDKELIQKLNMRLDSLNSVLRSERIDNSNKLYELSAINSNLESKISSITSSLDKLALELQTCKTENSSKINGDKSKQDEIVKLQGQLKSKMDSLIILRKELLNNTNQVAQTGANKSVKIGTQTWMAENLNISTFRNGDLIPEAKTNEEWVRAGINKQPAWCYYDNEFANGTKYRKLYNWYAVNDSRGLAPDGWHVPSDKEWTMLLDYMGSKDTPGKKMKSTNGWKDGGNGTNSSGFSALPGGYRKSYGPFVNAGGYAFWWTSSEYSGNYSWFFNLGYFVGNVLKEYDSKGGGLSVRCIKD